MASDGLATVKGFAGKLSITGWLLVGGFVIALLATFLPFATVSVNVFGMSVGSHEVSANGAARFAVFVFVAGGVALAWPHLSGSQLAVGRLIGLSVVVVVLVVLMVVWYMNVSNSNSQGDGVVKVSPGFGLLLYGAAVVDIAVVVVLLWIQRPRTQQQVY
jgi:hypothetical protein